MAFFGQKLMIKVGPNGLFIMVPNISQVPRGIATKFESIKAKRLHNNLYDLANFDPNLL